MLAKFKLHLSCYIFHLHLSFKLHFISETSFDSNRAVAVPHSPISPISSSSSLSDESPPAHKKAKVGIPKAAAKGKAKKAKPLSESEDSVLKDFKKIVKKKPKKK